MAMDVLTLGGYAFDNWSTPEHIPFGGEHAMVVHKLPGGDRVIDMLGPDDDDIRWRGRIFGDGAIGTALMLDGMRRAGQAMPLIFGGQSYMVVISHLTFEIERLPLNVLYQISCTPVLSLGAGAGMGGAGAGGFGGGFGGNSLLASADLSAALAL
jgi:hypothetical protein